MFFLDCLIVIFFFCCNFEHATFILWPCFGDIKATEVESLSFPGSPLPNVWIQHYLLNIKQKSEFPKWVWSDFLICVWWRSRSKDETVLVPYLSHTSVTDVFFKDPWKEQSGRYIVLPVSPRLSLLLSVYQGRQEDVCHVPPSLYFVTLLFFLHCVQEEQSLQGKSAIKVWPFKKKKSKKTFHIEYCLFQTAPTMTLVGFPSLSKTII